MPTSIALSLDALIIKVDNDNFLELNLDRNMHTTIESKLQNILNIST